MEYLMINGELCHHGIKGQKWGIRRYQNEDGTLTEAGKKRYGESGAEYLKAEQRYKKANKQWRREKMIAKAAKISLTAAGHPFAGRMAENIVTLRGSTGKRNLARNEYIKKRHDMLYETGKRKKLEGLYQTTGEDEVKYGFQGAKRIAKNRNKGMTKSDAYRREDARLMYKTIGKVTIGALGVYDTLSGGQVSKAALKGGLKAGAAIAKGIKAAKNMRDRYYNTTIFDSDGSVVTRYHDTFMRGEDVARKLLSA